VSNVSDKEGSDKDGPDKDLPDEQQLDEYLRGGSAVSQQYRQLRSADVPTELDRLVLRQAQEAVKARPAKSRAWMRWAGPLALAASTVLVVSIVIESGVHEETYLSAPASAPAETAAKQEAPEQPATDNAAVARDKAVSGNAADDSVVRIVPVQREPMLDGPSATFIPEPPAPSEDRMFAIQPTEPPAPAAPQFASPPPTESAEERPEELARREEVDANARTSAKAVTPIPASARARAPSQAQQQDYSSALEEVAVTGMKRREQKPTAGPRNTVAAPATADSAGDADEKQEEPRNYSEPEQWLRDIRQLRKENKHEQADREWRRFRYVFPNYEVADTDPARGALR
jgi:hypothetical protein